MGTTFKFPYYVFLTHYLYVFYRFLLLLCRFSNSLKMVVIRTVDQLTKTLDSLREQGKTIGLVPTMGALHKGHISLVNRARADNDIVVTSVFVNPTQFNNPNDLATYPRTEDADIALLEAANCDIAFVPTVEQIYPEPDNRVFNLGPVAEVMEGAMRPGHFNGVAQIVSKLFTYTKPHRAYFGEKDFQQIAVIRQMAKLENFNLNIISCPIIREDDGLAISSRNVRLSPQMRKIAPNIARILKESINFALSHSVEQTIDFVTTSINAFDGMEVEYYQIVDGHTLMPVTSFNDSDHVVGCITVYCGDVRLIDNIAYKR